MTERAVFEEDSWCDSEMQDSNTRGFQTDEMESEKNYFRPPLYKVFKEQEMTRSAQLVIDANYAIDFPADEAFEKMMKEINGEEFLKNYREMFASKSLANIEEEWCKESATTPSLSNLKGNATNTTEELSSSHEKSRKPTRKKRGFQEYKKKYIES